MKVLILVVILIATAYSQAPVEPVDAVEPVDPVEPVEPVEPATEATPVAETTTAEVIVEAEPEPTVEPQAEPEPTEPPTTTPKPTASPPGEGDIAGCLPPNGGGLQGVLNEFSQHIPVEQLYRRIIKAITTDSETQQVLAHVTSPEFHDLLIEVIQSPELTAFVDYACNELFLDIRYYFNMLLGLFGLPEFPPVMARASPGFRGLFLDMLDMIPTEKLKILMNERMTTDIYLQQVYPKLQSLEFTNIFLGLNNSTAYNEVLMGLRELQVDVDIVLDTIRRSFI